MPKALAVLGYLAARPACLVTKAELLDALWADVHVGDAALKTQLKVIRHIIGDDAKSPRFIETVHRRGYRFVAPVEHHHRGALPATQRPPAEQRDRALLGREADLARLDEALRGSCEGKRSILFVSGEPGIGKTTLANTFLEPLKRQGDVSVAFGQCVEQHGPSEAYLPILEALGRLARSPGGAYVVDMLRQRAPTWLMQMPDLWELPKRSGLERMASAAPERMLREFADVLQPLTEVRPLVLLLEDLHLADRCTLEWIAYLARRAEPARLLVIGTYRSTRVRHSKHPLWAIQQSLALSGQCDELRLAPLTEHEIALYLEARLGRAGFPLGLTRAVHAHTSGNPLFMNRVVDALPERGSLSGAGGFLQAPLESEAFLREVPASIVAAIEVELEQLTPFEQRVLEAASVAGSQFSTTVLALALDEDIASVEQLCLGWLRQERLLRRGEAQAAQAQQPVIQCEFMHSLYQKVIYDRIAPTRRCLLHQRIGRAESHRLTPPSAWLPSSIPAWGSECHSP